MCEEEVEAVNEVFFDNDIYTMDLFLRGDSSLTKFSPCFPTQSTMTIQRFLNDQ